jgi:ATP/maltotriose-dependent transcriptional regulator MalT
MRTETRHGSERAEGRGTRRRASASPKIVAPTLPASFIPRPGLEARLDEALDRRLTVLVAGAGFGKSTLLAGWAMRSPCAWYTLDRRDEALAIFAPQLVEALRRALPRLPRALVAALDATTADSGLEQADAVAALLCAEFRKPVALVFDDVHEVARGGTAARLLEALCLQAPPSLHLVLSSRVDLPFPIERLRSRGDVLTIDAESLAFSVDEVAALLAASLGDEAAELAPVLHGITDGWPAAVRLAVEELRAAAPPERAAVLERIRRPGSPLLAYLAEEVFAREPQEVRDLLSRAALLNRFTPDLCDALGVRRAHDTIAGLARRGLFVHEQNEWFTLHPFVRDFALQAWPLPEDDIRELHCRAAAWFERGGRPEEALRLLAAAGADTDLERLLSEQGEAVIAGGAPDVVIELAGKLPEELRGPVIERLVGQAHAVRGESDPALRCFRRAAGESEALPPELAWRLVAAHFLVGDLDGALAAAVRCPLAAEDSRDAALLLAWTARAQLRRGDLAVAAETAARALAAADSCRDEPALAAAHTAVALTAHALGDDVAWEAHLRLAVDAAERAGDVLQIVQIRNARGSMLLEEGSYGEAIEELEAAMDLAELAGFAGLRALTLMNRGLCHWCLGRLDQASSDYETAVRIYRASGTREVAYALVGRGDVYRERGDLALARAAYEEGLALASSSRDLQALVPGLYQLAKVLVDDDPEQAARLADRAVSYGWPDPAWALNAVGWIALVHGDRERAASAAAEAARAARDRRDRFGLAESLELEALAATDPAQTSRCLEEALAIWRELGNPLRQAVVELARARLLHEGDAHAAEATLRRHGVRISPAGPAGLLRFVAPEPSVPVAIETLGGFRVIRDGLPVALAEWQSRKARDLLKILVARRGRAAPRDYFMEALWPEEDPARLANRLSVALNVLRGVLDPGRRFPADHFVSADRSAVALRSENVRVDVEQFLADAEAGALAAAEAAYAGDFLEDSYEDWSVPLREEARAAYVGVARSLAESAAAAGEHDAACRYLLRILERDRYDEHAHLALVSALADAGRHGEARRCFRSYHARMAEIAVEPAPFPAA